MRCIGVIGAHNEGADPAVNYTNHVTEIVIVFTRAGRVLHVHLQIVWHWKPLHQKINFVLVTFFPNLIPDYFVMKKNSEAATKQR